MSMGPTAVEKQITMSSASSNPPPPPPPPPSVESSAPPSPRSSLSSSNKSTMNRKPPWLLPVLDDMEERMKMVASNTAQQDTGDTFAERAEAYYKRRPQLLSLLQDLYNAYLTLSDRYIQTIAKTNHRRRHSSQTSITDNGYYDDYHDQQDADGDTLSQMDSDVDSSLSYQQLPLAAAAALDDGMVLDLDAIVTEIVMKNVECDILLDEANTTERRYNDSSRKIELQKSLLEVLESERLILLHENAKLGYKMGALMEENKALASESMFIKSKAGELARCLLKVREDQRVCMLSRKIEDLQGQIYGLERRNKEYYEQLMKRDQWSSQLEQEESRSINNKSKFNGNEVNMEICFQIGKINRRLKRGNSTVKDFGAVNGKKGLSWWGKVKNMDLFLCGGST